MGQHSAGGRRYKDQHRPPSPTCPQPRGPFAQWSPPFAHFRSVLCSSSGVTPSSRRCVVSDPLMSSSASPPPPSQQLYLGIDVSTQSLKLTVIDQLRRVVSQVSVGFDEECPEYGTQAGVIRGSYGVEESANAAAAAGAGSSSRSVTQSPSSGSDDGLGEVITSPSLMFVTALERALAKLVATGLPLNKIVALSGSGQQHGSVYWRTGSAALLAGLSVEKGDLTSQLRGGFSVPNGPIWMDSSTGAQCSRLEAAVGGAQALADLTGSSAYERFTGPQISRVASVLPGAWATTEHVSLVSSMIPSLFLGSYAPVDAADAAGMNLMDIQPISLPFEWSIACINALAPGRTISKAIKTKELSKHGKELVNKLGPIVDSGAVLGRVAQYWIDKYNFSPLCSVVAFSGDNPCSLVGMGLTRPGDLGISLGTSDTLFGLSATPETKPRAHAGHVFPSPLDTLHARMIMLCFKNGSVCRERIRDQALDSDCASPSASASAHAPSSASDAAASSAAAVPSSAASKWDAFSAALASTPPGNDGHLFFAFAETEIVPHTLRTGYLHFGPVVDESPQGVQPPPLRTATSGAGNAASQLGARAVRGVVESQVLNMRLQSQRLGLSTPRKLLVTGGASRNAALVQLISDVFGVEVWGQTLATNDGASLGHVSDTASLGAAFRADRAMASRLAYAESAVRASSPYEGDEEPSTPVFPSSPLAQTQLQLQGLTQGAQGGGVIKGPAHIVETKLASPNMDIHALYDRMMPRFERLQALAVQALNQP